MNDSDENKIYETLFKIINLQNQLGEGDDDLLDILGIKKQPYLLSIEKKKRLEKELNETFEEYHLLLIELDRINIRHTPENKVYVDLFRHIVKNDCDLNEIWDDYFTDILEIHEDGDLLNRGAFLYNYYKLKPPYVKIGTELPKGIKNIYHESRWSFVYGQYSAAIALSRTVIEVILKHKFNLEGNLNDIIDLAREKNIISKKAAWNAHKVRVLANKILHKANVATEKQAKNSLDHILDFIEEIYFG